jgi:hypothetical protein
MPIFALFISAAKLAGVLATVTVAANVFSFSLYRKKNLKPFKSPIDESAEILASFNLNGKFCQLSLEFLNFPIPR